MRIPVIQNRSVRWLFAELLIVVVGILIAFQIEEWRTNVSDRASERILVENLISDLDRYVADFEEFNAVLRISIDSSIELSSYLKSDQEKNPDTLTKLITDASRSWAWRRVSPAYDGWVNSNRSDLISDEDLRTELQSFFDSYLGYFEIRWQAYTQRSEELINISVTEYTFQLEKDSKTPPYERSIVLITLPDMFPSNPEYLVRLDHWANGSNRLYDEINGRGLPLIMEYREKLVLHLDALN